jgi:YD repeat-containing protein
MGRLSTTTTQYSFLTSRTFSTAYSYDAASNRTGFIDPESGSTAYVYDTLNRLQVLTAPAAISGGSFGFGYDALSRRTSLTRPNAVNTAYSYDNLSRLLSVTHAKGATTLDGATYTVDNAGNRTAKSDLQAGVTTNFGFVELRNGYACSWCEKKENLLLLMPHPLSPVRTRQLIHPREGEIVGRVTGVAMRLAEMTPVPSASVNP